MPSFTYTPIVAKAHTPPYKIHKYFARRPHNVFNQLIENFTSPGEIILDPFCGGGVTIYEGVTQDRRVIGCDLNPLSTFIVRNMIKKSEDIEVLEKCFRELRCYLETLVKDYMFFELDNQRYDISWAEMALTIRCPKCGRPSPLANDLKIKNGKYRCSNKYCELNSEGEIDITSCERLEPQYIFLINAANRTRITKHFEEDDMVRFKSHIKFLKKEIIGHHINIPRDLIPMDWDRQFEDGLAKKGILYFQDFFTKRNLMILLLLKNRINSLEEKLGTEKYELVRIVFSNILKDCNIMSFTNAAWQGGSPTTWSKHAYWIPNQFCEVSIIPAFDKSVAKVLASIKHNNGINYIPVRTNSIKDLLENRANVLLYNAPIGHTDVPESSVDAIITDPPYGSNVQYLELSHFWYPWNQDLYERYPIFELEAVANRKKGFNGAKSQYDYENNLYEVFKNAYRVLKPMRYLSLTFNNKDICSWLALLFSSRVTIDNIRRIFSSFFAWLEEEDYIIKSPVRRIHKVKTGTQVKEVLSDENIEQLRDSCTEIRDLAIIDILASTGMRVGELVKLNREDINFNERECIVFGKGNKERIVYFNARAKIHLQQYLASRKDRNKALFVSLAKPHKRLGISGVETRLRKLGRSAKIVRVHPHKFRRTLATMAIDKGMPVEQVQRLLGHVKIDTTMHYAMVNQSNVKLSHRKFIN